MAHKLIPYLCLLVYYFYLPLLHADTTVETSLNLLDFNYEEFDQTGASFNKETDIIPGLTIALFKTQNNFTNSISFELYDGQVNYDGQTQSGAPLHTNTDETIYRLSYKLDWSPKNNNISIYGKFSWQQWDRNILPTPISIGLFEQYRWNALELGFTTSLYKQDKNNWQFELGISKAFNNTIEIDLNNLGFGQPKLDLGDGKGFIAALVYQHTLSNKNKISLSLRHQHWSFERSNTETISDGFITTDITEPRSITKHTIFSISYSYNF